MYHSGDVSKLYDPIVVIQIAQPGYMLQNWKSDDSTIPCFFFAEYFSEGYSVILGLASHHLVLGSIFFNY